MFLDDTHKSCSGCDLVKTHAEFSRNAGRRGGFRTECKDCTRTRTDRPKRMALYRFKMTPESLTSLVESQNGLCAVCSCPLGDDVSVDHDHACCPGRSSCGLCVRGALHRTCNMGLGIFKDDPEVLMAAVAYLLSSRSVLGGVPSR